MLNSARKGLSYAAMLVMLAASVTVADNSTSWQKGHPKRVQLNTRQAKQKLPQ
jgi:phage gp16-like protein